jgi:quercetin dioxygenase-like cupin family protein
MTIAIYRLNDLPRQTILGGNLSRTALRTDGALVTFNWFAAHTPRPEPHTHPFDQLVMVMEGRLNLEIDGEIAEMPPGSAAYVPPNAPHTAWPVGEDPVLNIDVFGTVREDYLFLTRHQEIFAGKSAVEGPASTTLSSWTGASASR